MKILHIDSSVNGENSITRELSAHAVSQLQAKNPDAEVTHLDLVANPVGPITGFPGVNDTLRQFQAHDVIVIGSPTYNFTVPSQLKSYFDHIAVVGETFKYTENGPVGLVNDKKVVVAVASGGVYEEGTSFEHNIGYVRAFFQFLGLEADIAVANGTAISDDAKATAIAAAKAELDGFIG